jgi:5-methyltetrahydropteroyltriglutamate--homocysteine methyltransferase
MSGLLRPPALKGRAKLSATRLPKHCAIEDREIERAIKKQEEIGLKLADGEFRRTWWHLILSRPRRREVLPHRHGISSTACRPKARAQDPQQIGFGHRCWSIQVSEGAHARKPKMTIPAPSTRFRRTAISKTILDLDAFFDDVAKAYQAAIAPSSSCRYCSSTTLLGVVRSERARASNRVATSPKRCRSVMRA